MHFHPLALRAFSEVPEKLPSISFIPENLFPSISAGYDVVDGTPKLNRAGRDTILCVTT
jgi:hypothetical protein